MEPVSVDVDFRKWGDSQHWRFTARLLGSDEFGTWLGAAPPTAYTGPRGEGFFDHAFVLLIPREEWWVAAWNSEGIELYVDVTTPPQWPSLDHVTMVDLDLDVIRERDGNVILDDEDEFLEHQVKYAYPEDVVFHAQSTADFLMDAVRQRREPFDVAPEPWMRSISSPDTPG